MKHFGEVMISKYVGFYIMCRQRLRKIGSGRTGRILDCKKGQGTTEYAILVGVLVVIAIVAVVAFRGKLEELWLAISEGINEL